MLEMQDYRKFCIDGNKKRMDSINNHYSKIRKTKEKTLKSNVFSFII